MGTVFVLQDEKIYGKKRKELWRWIVVMIA